MNIVVNEHVSPGHGFVLVDSQECESPLHGKWTAVQISTHNGVAIMTYDQWKTMLAIGMSMLMQDGN